MGHARSQAAEFVDRVKSAGAVVLRNGFVATTALGLTLGWVSLVGAEPSSMLMAVSALLLALCDIAAPLRDRVENLMISLAALIAGAGLGVCVQERWELMIAGSLILGIAGGMLQSSFPQRAAICRFALTTFLISSHTPQFQIHAVKPLALGALAAMIAAFTHSLLFERDTSAARPAATGHHRLWSREAWRFAIVFGTTSTLGLLLGDWLHLTRSYWVALTSVAVMRPKREVGIQLIWQRAAGTLLGVIIAGGILDLHTPRPLLVATALTAAAFLQPMLRQAYGAGTLLLSIVIFLLLRLLAPPEETLKAILLARVYDTFIGCALAVLGTLIEDRWQQFGVQRPQEPTAPAAPADTRESLDAPQADA